MKRVMIIRPHKITQAISDLKENWLQPFVLSNFQDMNLSASDHQIEVQTTQYSDHGERQECETEVINGTLIAAASHTVHFGDVISYFNYDNYICIAGETCHVLEPNQPQKSLWNVGIAIFKKPAESFHQFTAVIATQSTKDFDYLMLHVLNFSAKYQGQSPSDTQKRLIKELAKNNTNFLPMKLMLRLIFDEQPELSDSEKMKFVLDVLFKEQYGLDSTYVYNRDTRGIGIQYESKCISDEKRIYQKIVAKVHYMVFGNRVTFKFDISVAPETPEKLVYQGVEIELSKLNDNALELDEHYLNECIPFAFDWVKNGYMIGDHYFKNL